MSNTSNLVLPYLAVGQAQKHVTVNETLRKLDAIVQLSVVSATTAAQPSSPADGAVYIVPSGKSGTQWAAYANWSLGYYRDGAWVEITPREGWIAYVKDTDVLLAFDGAAWMQLPSALASDADVRDQTSTTKAVTPAGLAARARFSAHKGGTAQTGIAAATFTKVTFPVEAFDIGGHFDTSTSRWTPPAGPVRMSAGVYFNGGLSSGPLEVEIWKNGALWKAVSSLAPGTSGGLSISANDSANGTDYYEVYVYLNTASTGSVSGLAGYTFFAGEQI